MDKNPQYFQGVLQLRNPTEEIINFVADEIEKKEGVWIAKTKKLDNGVDLYISSNKFLKDIGKKLKEKFCGEMAESNTLFSRNNLTSKDVYRGCILFRHYNIKKGDTIIVRGESIKVISTGKEILGKNTKTNKKVHVRFEQLKK